MEKKTDRMSPQKRYFRILGKHILSFLLILVTVALLVIVLFQGILVKNLNEFNDQQQYNVLTRSAEKLQGEIGRVHGLVNRMFLYKELNPARIDRNV